MTDAVLAADVVETVVAALLELGYDVAELLGIAFPADVVEADVAALLELVGAWLPGVVSAVDVGEEVTALPELAATTAELLGVALVVVKDPVVASVGVAFVLLETTEDADAGPWLDTEVALDFVVGIGDVPVLEDGEEEVV